MALVAIRLRKRSKYGKPAGALGFVFVDLGYLGMLDQTLLHAQWIGIVGAKPPVFKRSI